MKNCFVCLSVFAAALLPLKADVLANWTFETPASTNNIIGLGLTVSGAQSGVNADEGTGTASSFHAQSTSIWSIPAGNGSAHSWSVNSNSPGDYLQFQVSTLGFQDIVVSYDQNGSATGPKTYSFQYSADGLSFTPVGADYALTSGISWSSGTPNQPTQLSFDLSTVSSLNDVSAVYFRIVNDSPLAGGAINGGNIGAAGTDRVDNFLVSATAVPEPSSVVLGLLGGMAGLMALRRQK
jgi:PEP-CTERM motif